MKDFTFSGEAPILILDFPSRLVEDAFTLDMNEEKLIVCLPHMLTKTAAREYRSSSSGNRTVRTDNEKIIIFTKGLLPAVRPIVELFRREQPRYGITFNRVAAFSLDEGDSKRASQSKTSVRSVFSTTKQTLARPYTNRGVRRTRTIRPGTKPVVSFMETTNHSTPAGTYYVDNINENLEVYHAEEP